MPNAQQPFGKIANFVVNSRLRFARNFILAERTRLRSSQPRQATGRYNTFMKTLLTITFLILMPKISFAQKLLWQSINKNEKFKYEYSFTFDKEELDSVKGETIINLFPNEPMIYQINSEKQLTEEELSLIMKCVKDIPKENVKIDVSKCSERKKYYVSIQI